MKAVICYSPRYDSTLTLSIKTFSRRCTSTLSAGTPKLFPSSHFSISLLLFLYNSTQTRHPFFAARYAGFCQQASQAPWNTPFLHTWKALLDHVNLHLLLQETPRACIPCHILSTQVWTRPFCPKHEQREQREQPKSKPSIITASKRREESHFA